MSDFRKEAAAYRYGSREARILIEAADSIEQLQSQVDRVREAKAKIDERINGKTVGEIKDAGDWPLCEASTWLYQALEQK